MREGKGEDGKEVEHLEVDVPLISLAKMGIVFLDELETVASGANQGGEAGCQPAVDGISHNYAQSHGSYNLTTTPGRGER